MPMTKANFAVPLLADAQKENRENWEYVADLSAKFDTENPEAHVVEEPGATDIRCSTHYERNFVLKYYVMMRAD